MGIFGTGSKKVLTQEISESLGSATSAKVDVFAGTGNLTMDKLTGSKQLLAAGTVQYMENQDLPTRNLSLENGRAVLAISAKGALKSGLRLPWAACNGATEWNIHLNPTIPVDITARSGGGNIKLDFSGMTVTSVLADTGGGNIDVILSDKAANVSVTAKTGAGNVTILMPKGMAARVQATSGLGKVIVEPGLIKTDAKIYQSDDYNGAAKKIDIMASSGAGNVSINRK